MKNIEIKPVTLDDVEQLSSIAIQAYLDHYTPIWKDNGAWYVEKVYNIPQLLSEILEENVAYFHVFQDNICVGFIKLKKNYPLSIGSSGLPFGSGAGSSIALNNALYIERIYFIKEAAGKGLGSFCFNFIYEMAKTLGRTNVWLMAMDTRRDAIRFYEKQGFDICGTWALDFDMMKPDCWGMVIMKKAI